MVTELDTKAGVENGGGGGGGGGGSVSSYFQWITQLACPEQLVKLKFKQQMLKLLGLQRFELRNFVC